MTKDEALKMAIEALLYGTDHTKAVKACKEALEQPTQTTSIDDLISEFEKDPEMKNLMQQERAKLLAHFEALEQPAEPRLVSYAPDGSTCTLNIDGEEVYFNREQPAQEPVEVYGILDDGDYVSVEATEEGAIKQCEFMNKHDCNCTYKPLYTHPHQWQGLTDDEILKLKSMSDLGNWFTFALAIEQALKEKNGL